MKVKNLVALVAEHSKKSIDDGPKDKGLKQKDKKMANKVGKMVQKGKTNPELMDLMLDFDPEHNPPEWVADKGIWEKAKEAVDPEGEGEKYDEPFAVVAHVYEKMGGGIK